MFPILSCPLSLLAFLAVFTLPCAAAGVEKFTGDLSFNFTLAAFNLTLSNANTTGVPLVLGQNGAITGAKFEVTSTYASYPFNDFPQLALHDTSLRAFTTNGRWITNATQTISGGTLGWLTTTFEPPPPAKGYTAISKYGLNNQFSVLAWKGRSDLWSLCPFAGGQVNVVYDAATAVPPLADCYGVKLNIVPIWGGSLL